MQEFSSLIEKLKNLYGDNQLEYQRERYLSLLSDFIANFGEKTAYFVSSPGRVEICGNHTDHNGGKVIACAINLDTVGAFLPTNNGIITIISQGYPAIEIDLEKDYSNEKGNSLALVYGVVEGLRKNGRKVGGFKACITSNVLGGAGISSSASFELLIVEILNFLYNDSKILPFEKAKIAQYSENDFFGKSCGLLDQSAIAFGGVNYFDFENKNNLKVEKVKNNLKELSFVLVDTGSSHADLSDEYSAIPQDMYLVAKFFEKNRLCEISKKEFDCNKEQLKSKLSSNQVDRAEHFFEENLRVEQAKNALENGDYILFFNALNQSGESSYFKLKNCYVEGDKVLAIPKALEFCKKINEDGAVRIHGGGFAGCVLCALKGDKTLFISKLKEICLDKNIIPVSIRENGVIVL